MMTSSNGNIFRVTGHLCGVHRLPVNSAHIGQWDGAMMFSLICDSINGWVNYRKAGDVRRHRIHYDVTVMMTFARLVLDLSSPPRPQNALHPPHLVDIEDNAGYD